MIEAEVDVISDRLLGKVGIGLRFQHHRVIAETQLEIS